MSPKGPSSYVPQRPLELSVPQGPRCCVSQRYLMLSVLQRPQELSVPQMLSVPQRSQVLNVLQRHIMGTKGLGPQLTVLLGDGGTCRKESYITETWPS